MSVALRSRGLLDADETLYASVGAFWTRGRALPTRHVRLLATDRRVVVTGGLVSPYALLVLPFVLPFALLIAGWVCVVITVGAALSVTVLGPRRLVSARARADISAQSLITPSRPLSWLQRELVEITFKDGDLWRLSSDVRNVRSAASIEQALAQQAAAPK